MNQENTTLKRITCGFAAISGLVAYHINIKTVERAASGCGEYSRLIDSNVAFTSLVLVIPSLMLIVLVFATWERASWRFASLTTTSLYLSFLCYLYIKNAIRNYSPCDSRGDNQFLLILLLGFIAIPLLWTALVIVGEVARLLKLLWMKLKERNGYR